MTTFEFYPPAEQEYLDSARYYDDQGEGLGDYFVRDIEAAIIQIRKNPLTWRKISRHARRFLASNFPYQVIYTPARLLLSNSSQTKLQLAETPHPRNSRNISLASVPVLVLNPVP